MTGAKMRVYEIAKEVGIPNKDLIAKIRALGLEVNNHMSSLDADDVARIKRSLEKEKQSVAQPQQTQKLSTGTVLRRRSSGEKPADASSEERSVERPPVAPPASTSPSGGPVFRRPAQAAPTPPAPQRPAQAPSAAQPSPVAVRPAAVERPSERVIERPSERAIERPVDRAP